MLPLFTIFSLILSMNAYSLSKIQGKLLERGTKKPLPGVNVFILPHKLKATTDDMGNFDFSEIPDGPFEFIVNFPGYLKLTQKSETNEQNKFLYLERERYDLFETTVTGVARKKDISKKVLTQKDFINAPGAQEDPLKAVQNLPGIANQSFSAEVVIQGSAPDDTRYTLNRHEIPIAFHFGGLSSIVMPQAVNAVEFLASGYGPEYGRALGGIINLETRAPKQDRFHGMAFVDLYNAGFLFEGPIAKDHSLFVSSRYGYIGYVFQQIAKDMDDFNLTVAPTFTDSFIQYEGKLSQRDDLSAVFIRSNDRLEFVLPEPVDEDPSIRGDFFSNTEFFRLIPRWIHRFSDQSTFDLSVALGKEKVKFEAGTNFFDLDSKTTSIRSEFFKEWTPNYSTFLGLDFQYSDINIGIKFPRSGSNDNAPNSDVQIANINRESWENSIYWRNEINLIDEKLSFSPGLRLTRFTQTKETYLVPRLSSSYILSDSLLLKTSYGIYYQQPQRGEPSPEFGNPDLRSEKASHYTLGFEKDFRAGSSNGLTWDIDFFYKELSHLVINSEELKTDGSPLIYSNKGTGSIIGAQSLLKWRKNDFSLVAAYTFLQSKRDEPGKNEFPSDFDQTHNLNLITSYEMGKWNFSSRLRYVTGRPFTPIDRAIYDGDSDVYIPIEGEFFSKRLDSFFQLDLRADRKWVYDSWILSAYLDIQNVTSRENVESIDYNFDYSDSVKTSGLPVIPIFGIKGEF